MSRSNRRFTITAALRLKLEVAAALARERLMEVHFHQSMELVEYADGQLDPSRALAIYARLHGLPENDVEALHHRVFVALGQSNPRKPAETGAADENAAPESPQSILGVIRRRLRGRVNTELREWVEYHTGRAETELLWTHVENALKFIEVLGSTIDIGDAVALYASELVVPASRVETIYYLVLAHLSTIPVPATTADPPGSGDTKENDPPDSPRHALRLPVENAGRSRRAG